MPNHVIKPGETLFLLAKKYGLESWRDIFDAPENEKLKAQRPAPGVLAPDEKVSFLERLAALYDPAIEDRELEALGPAPKGPVVMDPEAEEEAAPEPRVAHVQLVETRQCPGGDKLRPPRPRLLYGFVYELDGNESEEPDEGAWIADLECLDKEWWDRVWQYELRERAGELVAAFEGGATVEELFLGKGAPGLPAAAVQRPQRLPGPRSPGLRRQLVLERRGRGGRGVG